uniref:protein adenylyltransferase n=1 Tax=Fervidicoccus fontis TaxID=683846 RepID=A0A7J3ZIN8_9CREN
MTREKVSSPGVEREVVYSERRWKALTEKRCIARELMEALRRQGIHSIVHGSVARGDVKEESDVDVFVPYVVPSFKVELALESTKYKILQKKIVQATPKHTPKAYLILDPQEGIVVSFPLAKMTTRELEFYYFGGALDLSGVIRGERRPGVNKRLEIVIPTPRGHVEYSILGRESEVARILGISIDTVLERVRVLTRRDEVGRTGVFLERTLSPEASIEAELEILKSKNPALRRAVEERV